MRLRHALPNSSASRLFAGARMMSFSFWFSIAAATGLIACWAIYVGRRLVRSFGAVAVFAPATGFVAVYAAAFLLRPVFMHWGLMPEYEDGSVNAILDTAIWNSTLGVLGFALGGRSDSKRRRLPGIHASTSPRRLRAVANALCLLSIITSLFFLMIVVSLGAATSDFGVNRAIFSASTFGRGYIFLVNTLAAAALLSALAASISEPQVHRGLKFIAIICLLAPNILVTNRFLVTAVIAGWALVWLIRRSSKKVRVPFFPILSAIAVVAVAGAGLGLIRGGGELVYDEKLVANPLVFFLFTFDMAEMLALIMRATPSYDFGQIWLEDVAFQFIPRALWATKPTIYGAIRAQQVALPSSVPADEILLATYPIGLFGEGYFAAGLFGIFLAGFLARRVLERVFSWAVDTRYWGGFIQLTAFPTFVLQCLNPLGYFRSFGWFLGLLLFHFVVSALCVASCKVIVNLWWMLRRGLPHK